MFTKRRTPNVKTQGGVKKQKKASFNKIKQKEIQGTECREIKRHESEIKTKLSTNRDD